MIHSQSIQADPFLATIEEQFRQLIARKDFYLRNRAGINAALNALKATIPESKLVRIEFSYGRDLDCVFTGGRADLNQVWHWLRSNGWKLLDDEDRPKANDAEWSNWFSHKEQEWRIWLHFSSSTCRRVQVGTKTVEQPVYETHCDDEQTELGQLLSAEPQLEKEPF